jgi:hypothetical protein
MVPTPNDLKLDIFEIKSVRDIQSFDFSALTQYAPK